MLNFAAFVMGCSKVVETETLASEDPLLIYGQVTGTVVDSRKLGMRNPNGIGKVGSQLMVADNGGERILIYNSVPTQNQIQANVVLGQRDAMTDVRNAGGISASTLASPQNVVSDGTRLFVADRINHRILIWNSIPASSFSAADVVLGQPNMTSNTANNTPGNVGVPSAQSLYYPTGLFVKNGKLFVADSYNHRVLIWNTIPTSNQQAADIVVGQPNMTTNASNSGGVTGKSLAYPNDIAVTNSQMIIADTSNSRILIWNTIPSNPATDNFSTASIVLGQANFSIRTENTGGVSAQSLALPGGVYTDGNQLYVSDTKNNRVLIWSAIPSNPATQQRAAANLVLGQPSMNSSTANNGGVSAQSLSSPYGIFVDGTALYIADSLNHRILTWNTLPTTNQQAADKVLGQPDLTSNLAMNPGGITGSNVSAPRSYSYIAGSNKVMVADAQSNRILIWNSRPSGNYAPADVVLGQSSMTTYAANNGGLSARSLSYPTTAYARGNRLFVVDRDNHRVLIWTSIPTANNTPANIVLGQPNFISNSPNNTPGAPGTVSAQSMWFPNAVYFDGTKLYVSDTSNARLLIWNTLPTVNQQAANVVLGQPDMVSRTINNGGLSARSLWNPQGMTVRGTKLYVCDMGNNRVLIWNTIPTVNNAAANVVLGQPNMTSNTSNNGGIGNKSLAGPIKIFATGTHLGVADYSNHRIMIWKPLPTSNNKAATKVLGQSTFTVNTPNWNGVTDTSLSRPGDVFFDASRFIIVDTGNDRILDTAAATTLP